MSSQMAQAIRALVQDKGISEELVMKTVEEVLLAAYKRKFGISENAVIRFSEDGEGVTIFAQKRIVDELDDPVTEIELNEALELNEDAELGDELLIEINPKEFDRVSIQSAKQKARQTLREIQKDTLYSEYKDKINELVIGYYQRERNGAIFVDLGRTEGIMPRRYQSPREIYRPNDRIRALIYEVEKTPTGLQIILSRTHTEFVRKIFELEVPEIYDRTIEPYKIVREPGYRTKMAVYSVRDDVDPVGACVGMRGVRIQAVVRELEGEKIDVLKYDPDPRMFIKNALQPAEVEQIIILDEIKRQALAVVPENQFSLAIGRQGLNVRLANRLTDWSIDVKTRAQVEELQIGSDSQRAVSALFGDVEDEISQVTELPGIPAHIASLLTSKGIVLIETLVAMSAEELAAIEGLTDPEVALLRKLIDENIEIVEDDEDDAGEETEIDDGEEIVAAGDDDGDAETQSEAAVEGAAPAAVETPDAVVAAAATEAAQYDEDDDPDEEFEEEEITAVSEFPGMPEPIIAALTEAGVVMVEALINMSETELKAVEGLSDEDVATVLKLIEETVEIVDEDVEEDEED